jgi:hypothetical protein
MSAWTEAASAVVPTDFTSFFIHLHPVLVELVAVGLYIASGLRSSMRVCEAVSPFPERRTPLSELERSQQGGSQGWRRLQSARGRSCPPPGALGPRPSGAAPAWRLSGTCWRSLPSASLPRMSDGAVLGGGEPHAAPNICLEWRKRCSESIKVGFEADTAEKQITRASVVGVKPVLRLWSLAGGEADYRRAPGPAQDCKRLMIPVTGSTAAKAAVRRAAVPVLSPSG